MRTFILFMACFCAANAATVKIAYSDWPGWLIWDVAILNNWFAEEGIDVQFVWNSYENTIQQFIDGQIDAVSITNGDMLSAYSAGSPRPKCILVNDYSNGNDKFIARPGISSASQLEGKRLAVSYGLVSHLLASETLDTVGVAANTTETIDMRLNSRALELLQRGTIDAVAAWQPVSENILRSVAGAVEIASSADVDGLIFDLLCVSETSLAQNRDTWKKVIKVWHRITDELFNSPLAQQVHYQMGYRVNVKPDSVAELLGGTRILRQNEHVIVSSSNKTVDFPAGETEVFTTLESTYRAHKFNVINLGTNYNASIATSRAAISNFFDFSLYAEVLNTV